MMNFKLVQHSSNRAKTTFHVLNSADDICGSINVARGEENDLLKHWAGARAPAAKPGVPRVRLPALSKKAILRGC